MLKVFSHTQALSFWTNNTKLMNIHENSVFLVLYQCKPERRELTFNFQTRNLKLFFAIMEVINMLWHHHHAVPRFNSEHLVCEFQIPRSKFPPLCKTVEGWENYSFRRFMLHQFLLRCDIHLNDVALHVPALFVIVCFCFKNTINKLLFL